MAVITLLTDFGAQDEYAGVLKGAVLSVDPSAVIVDLSHGICPQAVDQAARMLAASYAFFPTGSIHVAVVDPGVGTSREIIAVRYHGHYFLAPNNGLLWPLVLESPSSAPVFQVENKTLFRHPVSRTFHGRDIFAPVAGHLSKGVPLDQLGRLLPVERVKKLEVQIPELTSGSEIRGLVVSVDRFGNLVTNIGASHLAGLKSGKLLIDLSGRQIEGVADSYADGKPSAPVALLGSRGCLEIAVYAGSAADLLNCGKGTPVAVRCAD